MVSRVGVIGGGLAGLACALAAARAGAEVELFEAAALKRQVDAHVEVVPNMLRDLVRLGLGPDCVREGFPFARTSVFDISGQRVLSVPAERLAGERFPAALGISYRRLLELLASAARAAGARLHAGSAARDVDAKSRDSACVRFDGGKSTEFDLVVLACGADDPLRQRVFGASRLHESREASWSYFMAPRPRVLDEAVHATGLQGLKAHLVPVSGTHVGVRLSAPQGHVPRTCEQVRGALGHFAHPVADVVRAMPQDFEVVTRTSAMGLLPAPWHRGCVIATGHCAHALSPHFGQAGAQGIEDAIVLGALLSQPLGLAAVAESFTARRIPRVAKVHAITSQAARWVADPEPETDLLALSHALAALVAQPA